MRVARALEEREREHDAQLARQRLEARDERVPVDRVRALEEALALRLRPVVALEELRQQHHRRAAARRLAHQVDGLRDVRVELVAHPHLDDAERRHDRSPDSPTGCCWVTQWNDPPPVMSARDITGTTSRPGKSGRRISTARASW